MNIQASEISKILKEQIKNFGDDTEVAEVGKVLSVGDGIARVYGLDKVQAGEMVEFAWQIFVHHISIHEIQGRFVFRGTTRRGTGVRG